jgi:hypothetical protein
MVRASHDGDRFDFDKLIRVSQGGDSEQSAWSVVLRESRPDHLPDGHQVATVARRNIDRRFQNLSQRGSGLRQCLDQISHGLPGLGRNVTNSDDRPSLIQGTGTRGVDQGAWLSDRGVRVGNTAVQAVRAEESHSHSPSVPTLAVFVSVAAWRMIYVALRSWVVVTRRRSYDRTTIVTLTIAFLSMAGTVTNALVNAFT